MSEAEAVERLRAQLKDSIAATLEASRLEQMTCAELDRKIALAGLVPE